MRPSGPGDLAPAPRRYWRSSSLGILPPLSALPFLRAALYEGANPEGEALILTALLTSLQRATDGHSAGPISASIRSRSISACFQLRWYSLAYLAGIIIGWWYLLKLLAQPGAPMARRHADDLVFYATLGIIFGGRLGYVLFYNPAEYLQHPLEIVRLWDGGMSFHGGVIGVSLGIFYLAWRQKLDWLRIHDYVACCVPFGLFFGRLANFVNGELWGAPTDVPWAIVFPTRRRRCPRHPSQLYEAVLEGIVLFAILAWSCSGGPRALPAGQARRRLPPRSTASAASRVEFVREPDEQLVELRPGDPPPHGPVAVAADDPRRPLSGR